MIKCNNCISCCKWSRDNTRFLCITLDIIFNRYQILKEHNCDNFVCSEEKLIDV